MYAKNTKIVCTLGPSSDSVSEITKLVQAGMNVARLNFSHGSYENHSKIIANLRTVEKITGKRIGILQDLQGPKIRLGELPEGGLLLKKSETINVSNKKQIGSKSCIPLIYKTLQKDLKKGDLILINDGLVILQVLSKNPTQVKCLIKASGLIKSHAGIHFPRQNLSIETITEKDKKDLKFGLSKNVDYIALSFVKSAKDIEELRKMIAKHGKSTKIIAKIERLEAIKNLEFIVKAADGIMVARGDLGLDIPAEQVPIAQKLMIRLANKYAKPVITATEVLLSMVTSPRATRAEVSDAANAVLDHTDAIMLSNESAVGKFPSQAAATLSKVASNVEQEIQKYPEIFNNFSMKHHDPNSNPDCLSACELSRNSKADYIVVYTSDGYSAREISKHRIYTPIITITESEVISRELTLAWGLNKIFTHKIPAKQSDKIKNIIDFLKKEKAIKKGQKLVIVCNASKKEKLISNVTI